MVDASSSQSRADVVIIGLSAVLVLTGLQWLSLRPKPLVAVSACLPAGTACQARFSFFAPRCVYCIRLVSEACQVLCTAAGRA